jgi:hypothetical protein
MSKIVSDAHLWLSVVGAADPPAIPITSIDATGAQLVLTVGATTLAADDMAVLSGTNDPYLDGQAFRVASATATTVTLADADPTKLGTPKPTAGSLTPFSKAGAVGLLTACMATVTVAGQAPASIQLDDMCGSETKLGDAKPPTITFQGFSDKDSEGYKNLWRASVTDPKPVVWALIDYTDEGGYIFGPLQVGEISITAATNQGLQFNGTGTFTEIPTYSWTH